MSTNYDIEKLAFEGPKEPDRGYTIKAFYLKGKSGDALIQIFKDGNQMREFLYPAYKIYNLAAHFSDIVDSEIAQDTNGGGKSSVWGNPIAEALKDAPAQFAAGVDVRKVVEFVLTERARGNN